MSRADKQSHHMERSSSRPHIEGGKEISTLIQKRQPLATTLQSVDDVIHAWDPEKRHETCANCKNCIVLARRTEPMAYCQAHRGKRYGEPISLYQLLRAQAPYSWLTPTKCPDFQCMTDNCEKENHA